MIMNVNLFRLALERLEPSDWAHFELLSSAFLTSEFKNLRTMASPAGDGGRDSELFCPDGKPFIAAQYSVAKDWRAKIRHTAERLIEKFPEVRFFLYLSNHQIGGQSDDIKEYLLERNIVLDVRDRNWFIERASSNYVRENAAEELIDRIARPYFEGEEIISKPSSPLSSGEARAALLYLGLQWQDDISDKGLTKLSFDAMVRSALRHTHSDNRLPRSDVYDFVCKALPSADRKIIIHHVDNALKRLTKRYIRHWQKADEFCLTYEESQRITSRLAEMVNEESDFREDVARHIDQCVKDMDHPDSPDRDDLQQRIFRVIEKLLLKHGEVFVSALVSGNLRRFGLEDLTDIILDDLSQHTPPTKGIQHLPATLGSVVGSLLTESTLSTQKYIRRLANSYTLLSFLNETPDVQSAMRKLFSHGTVWLDTTVLLPIFAEQLDDDPKQGRFTRILYSCRSAGIELRVTSGVIQEINSHMNNALTCSQYVPSEWRGRTPYLYGKYLHTGKQPHEFRKWLALFRGYERPEDDIMQFLIELFDIKREDLEEASKLVADELRWAADRLWTEAHKKRRRPAHTDEGATQLLIKNDLETYLGVIGLRQSENVTELGYRHWLFTRDSIAWQIRDLLRDEFPNRTPPSPLLSLSFLINNLTFGENRRFTNKADLESLPLLLDVEMSESQPQDILIIADDVRMGNEGLPDYVIKRKVRDAIDRARRSHGCSIYSNSFDLDDI
jgi:hypothetical protein